ncbi:hypothetical protein SAMN05444358_1011448 [Ruegeria halocynthiae]|uniref:Uncharacterized protein n=1 Tax=Ruegeria halocynthiae TaxID=985054 RepID=A0A1H2VE04_9RHOB|nr:hypothetical protein [Ruegeria halocynthiae]SDW66583.1 hypothetical protein SAMN05444358_1011448 [Ruegeria halocynthiae]
MAAEVACESSFSELMRNTVVPLRIVRNQKSISSAQLALSGRLIKPAEKGKRGQIVVYFDLVHLRHCDFLIPSGSCMALSCAFSLSCDMGDTIVAHAIRLVGIINIVGLRIRAWIAQPLGFG